MRSFGMPFLVIASLAVGGVTGPLHGAEPAATPAASTAPSLVPPPPAAAPAAQPEYERVADPGEMAADALVVRPLGLAATAVGAAIYVVALPFAAISGDVHAPARSLVGAPARFTFKRKLGDFGGRPL